MRVSGFKGELIRVRSASLSKMSAVLDLNIEELIGTHLQALDLADLAKQSGKTIKVHIALNDGGMGRNGIDMTTEAGKKEAVYIATQPSLSVVGIMTHFPNYNAGEVRANWLNSKRAQLG